MQNLDILLINPGNRTNIYQDLASSISAIEPPLWMGLIAGFIRENGFSVKIIDADAESFSPEYTVNKIIESAPLLIGISAIGANPSASSTPKMTAANRILHILKEKAPYLKTFLYGIHPSALPERTLKEEPVDFILKGECFYTISELLEKLKFKKNITDYKIKGLWYQKDGEIFGNGWGRLVKDLDELPFVAWDLLPMDKYRTHNWHCFGHLTERRPYAVIYTGFGCPFNCTYCNIHALYNGKPGIRFRSIKKVVDEIGFLVREYKVKNIKILDELFVLKEKRVEEFCDLIIQRGYDLNMCAYARIDTVNEKLLEKMKRAGINWLAFGIESGNKKIREGVAKIGFQQNEIKKIIEMTHNSDIYIVANFIFGLPEDDLESMQDTLNLAEELNCEYTNFYVAMAYPGSQLYEDAVSQGIELPKDWLGYSQFSKETVPLATKYLSSADILRFRDEAFEQYHSNPKYLKMIEDKFGSETVRHIKEMLTYKIERNLFKK